jgi:hypothetical protein
MMRRVPIVFTVSFLAVLFLVPLIGLQQVAAANEQGVLSPGSTTTIMGMPVIQTGKNFAADTDCTVVDADNNTIVTFTTDSDGKCSFTISEYSDYGSNQFYVQTGAGSFDVSFSINNMDVLPYLIPVIVIAVIFSLMKAFSKW